MSLLVIVGVLFGIVLGQFFKCYVLIPACGLALVFVLADPAHMNSNLLDCFFTRRADYNNPSRLRRWIGRWQLPSEPMRSKRPKNPHFDEISSSHAETPARDRKAA